MCSICGIYSTKGFDDGGKRAEQSVIKMNKSMKMRGPDGDGTYTDCFVSLGHNRLSVIDPEGGAQPMSVSFRGREYIIVYNGEIYNAPELRERLLKLGASFKSRCDTEVVLWSYIMWKEQCPTLLNGIFAFIVYDKAERKLFACRDRLGVKPLYYTRRGDEIYFASESKALLACMAAAPKIDKVGLWQLLYLAPATVSGQDVFRDIKELNSADCAVLDENGMRKYSYWKLEAKEFKDSAKQAAEKTYELLYDAVCRQLVSDVPLCAFLSGGLDSSVITAIACRELEKRGERLDSYSFEYEGNKENFKSSLFQPEGDDKYAAQLARILCSNHTVLSAPEQEVAKYLDRATLARDYPGQADIDSSLLYYCERVRKNHTVALSGECSDEIFGGYPWFYREEMLERDFFPWVHDPMARISLFNADKVSPNEGSDYMSRLYKKTLEGAPCLDSDSPDMVRARQATVLSASFYMAHLLCRKDRMSMACSLEVRVPFADHRIIEYVYNVPWKIKFEGGVEKALLRSAAKVGNLLPDRYLYRKKSPYPKTHSPEYERAVDEMLKARLGRDDLFNSLIDREKVVRVIEGRGENLTWYGQLMSRPQLVAWLYQLSYWFENYNVQLV